MTIILDPSMTGCTFYSDSFVYTRTGDPISCCEWLRNRVIEPGEDGRQIHNVAIDSFGCGRAYVDLLIMMGVTFTELHRMIPSDLPNLHDYK